MSIRKERRSYLGIRLVVGLVILVVLLFRLDLGNLVESARRSSIWLLGIAFLIMGARLLIGARRWRLTCGSFLKGISFWRFYAWYMESSFFNIFMPSQGGDLVRAFRLAACNGGGPFGVSTVLAERVLGLTAMLLLAGVGLWTSRHGNAIPGIKLSFLLVAMATAIVLVTLFYPACSRTLVCFFRGRKWSKAADFAERCAGVFADLARRPTHLLGIILYSLAMQLMCVTAVYVIGLGFSIPVSFAFFLVEVPIVWLVVTVPVSLNGIGTREAANIALLSTVGIPAESAMLLSVMWSGQLILIGLIGGVFHLWLSATETKLKAGESIP